MNDALGLRFKRIGDHDMPVPRRATPGSAAFDLPATTDVTLWPSDKAAMPLGWAVEPPPGWALLLLPRSGLGSKHGIVLANTVGLIDPDYRGELIAMLWCRRAPGVGQAYTINKGDHIAQLMLVPVPDVEAVEVSQLSDTRRGAGGFGSTGA